LNTDEIQCFRRLSLNLQAQLDSFPDSRHQLIRRPRLCVATAECRHGRHIESVYIPLNDNIVFSNHDTVILQKDGIWRRSGN